MARRFHAMYLLTVAPLLALLGSARAGDDFVITPEKKNHWAWKAPVSPPLPNVRNEAWVKNPIDRFVLAKLESAGLQPAPLASREQLIRRVTLDLIGLPPTPEEIDAFVDDASVDAWEKVIDRLLASPHCGERWGRHWLDLARFAESNGYEFDEARPNAWRYRDYVVASFNSDKPYDRFIKEQVAGDELDPDDPQALIATGFNLLGPDMTDSSDKLQRRQNTLNDMTDTTGLVFLGLTLGCARCHDHKFEPIPQLDYYRLQAFFKPAQFRHDVPVPPKESRSNIEASVKAFNAQMKPLQDSLHELEEPFRHTLLEAKLAKFSEDVQRAHRTAPEHRSAGEQELVDQTSRLINISSAEIQSAMGEAEKNRCRDLQTQIKKLEGKKPAVPMATGMQDAAGPAAKTFVLIRGELSNPGEEVQAGFPIVLTSNHKTVPAPVKAPKASSTGRRMALANWLAGADNPLTGRVMVNRLWQHHFGRGIVCTPSDLGVHGEPPTHPELLDWLACQFVENGWKIKQMHKLMLLSATYQQTSMPSADALKKDAGNRLLSRMNRVRLEAEIVRDSLLAVSGRLNDKIGGPSVFPPLPSEAAKGAGGWTVTADKRERDRRSIYIFARRNLRFPLLESFDLPDSNLSCPKRECSTTAPQALALLNAGDVIDASKALADKVATSAKTNDERVALLYRLALGRRPSATEAKLAREFLERSPLHELCRALFNLNEFIYLD